MSNCQSTVGVPGASIGDQSRACETRLYLFLYPCIVCVCVLSSYLFWTSGLWTYQPGPHRRKVTQDFSSTFLLLCLHSFFSREVFSRSFPSSTVKSNFCVPTQINRSPLVGHFFFFFPFLSGKIPVRVTAPGFELMSQGQKVCVTN